MTDINVIIVNYNAGSFLVKAVLSVLAVSRVARVIVVDNASKDSSMEALRSLAVDEPRIICMQNEKNLGFARACNLGIQAATENYLLFLNPDCKVQAGALEKLIDSLEKNKRVGMAGPLLQNPNGKEQAGGRRAVPTPWRSFVRVFGLSKYRNRYPKLFSDFQLHQDPLPDGPVEVEAISGSCMMVKREALAQIGCLDEEYFLHCEDLDWCMRFRQRGWEILFVPDARVVHSQGTCSKDRPIFVEWHKHKGMMRFYRKFFHHQYPGALLWLVGAGVWLRFGAVALHYSFALITDNYAWLKKLNNLAKKSGLILKKQGPVFLVKKIFSYLKGRNDFKINQNEFTFSSQPTAEGINVVGYLCAETGLGESARTLINSIKTTRINHSIINYKLYWLEDNDQRFAKEFTKSNPHNVNVIVINPEGLDFVLPNLRKEFFQNRYNIGYWAWELPDIPTEWEKYEKYFDEFWVPSEFVKQAILKKINRPVTIVPHSIEIKSFEKYGRDHFGLDDKKFLFSFIFDYNSLFERKNPVAIVRSFKQAFNGNEDVSLVIKCSNPKDFSLHHTLLLKEINKDKRIKIISKRLTRDEVSSLLDVSDAYVSLHRSEGYGLTMAEAMFLGKPVICTNYSGNIDFTKENNSFLVNYKKILLVENIGPYQKGNEWADPDIHQAAKFMSELYDKKELRNEIGNLGRDYIHNNLNPESIGKIIEKRLEQINQLNDYDDDMTLPHDFERNLI